jgi:TRAP-type C4-dicarboxylate transport system permease small subunit
VVKVLVYGVTAGICAIVAWFSLQFVLTSREFDDRILGNVPAWWLQMVLPVGFGLITWRYGLFFLRDLAKLFMRKRTP